MTDSPARLNLDRKGRPLVLITGARGKVGRPLLLALVANGFDVRALTSTSAAPQREEHVEWRHSDLVTASSEDLAHLVRGCAAVVHLAVEQSDVEAMEALNVRATGRLLDASQAAGVHAFCFTSSIAVYGSTVQRIAIEQSRLIDVGRDRPEQYWVHESLRAYGRSKVRAEGEIRSRGATMHRIVLRPSVIVDDEDLRAAASMTDRQRAAAWRQSTQHIPLDDVVAALVWAVERGLAHGGDGRIETFNLTSERDGGRYRDLFRAAGSGRGRSHGLPMPGIPLILLRTARWASSGRRLPVRYPMGASSFPSELLRSAGFKPPLGIASAQSRAFGHDRTRENNPVPADVRAARFGAEARPQDFESSAASISSSNRPLR